MGSIGRYELIRHLARGGMADVYLARMGGVAGFQKTVVVKQLLPSLARDAVFVEMFLDEARLAAQLNHANVVQIFDLGEQDGQYFIAMEYLDGPSLFRLIEASRQIQVRLPLEDGLYLLSRVLEALAYAHSRTDEHGQPLGLIHRDVSPENILLSRAGEVKLADFGIARAANRRQSTTASGSFKGKLHYLAPEMLRGEAFDARSDLFSTGVVLYQVLTGRLPFDGANGPAILDSLINDTPRPVREFRPKMPAALQQIVDRALAKNPRDRYPRAQAMQSDLQRVMRDLGSAGPEEIGSLIATLCPEPAPGEAEVPATGIAPTYVPRRLSGDSIPAVSPKPRPRPDPSKAKTQPFQALKLPDRPAEAPASRSAPTERALPAIELDDDDEPPER
jgi:serine/threonine-protein kinase